MRWLYEVSVEVERDEGKFASRDELGDQILEALDADPGSLVGDEGGTYSVVEWDVNEIEVPRGKSQMFVTRAERRMIESRREQRKAVV